MRGRELSLLLLILIRHLLGISASCFSGFELFILDGDEFRTERGDLFLRSRAHVRRGHHTAEAAGGPAALPYRSTTSRVAVVVASDRFQ